MKLFIVTLVLFSATAVLADVDDDWEEFKSTYGKVYLSPTKENKRKAAFVKNKCTFDELKAAAAEGTITYEAKLYAFHDLEPEEFAARKMGLKAPSNLRNMKPDNTIVRQTLPISYDSRTVINFSDVRDQGNCGSCWTFSATNSLEVAYSQVNGETIDLSEQQLVDCVYSQDGCDGGWMSDAWDYISQNGGQTLESDYPYTGVSTTCLTDKTPVINVQSWTQISADTAIIQSAIMQYGSLAIAVDANSWSYYKSGVFKATKVGSINHAVNLIGWGYDAPTKQNYWLIRNSWGSGWGENGYIRVSTSKLGTYVPQYTYAVTIV